MQSRIPYGADDAALLQSRPSGMTNKIGPQIACRRVPHFSRLLREVGLLAYSPRWARGLFQCSSVTHVTSHYRSHAYREAGLVRINAWAWWEEKIRQSSG